MTVSLEGLVVCIIGPGDDYHRAVSLACAEAGAALALATLEPAQEFAVASVANEVWAIGQEQLSRAIDATDPAAVAALAAEVLDRCGRCDGLVCAHDRPTDVGADELGPAEFDAAVRANLTGPFLAAQAFGRLMERAGKGLVLLVDRDTGGDAAYRAAKSGLTGLAAHLDGEWAPRGVRVLLIRAQDALPHAVVGLFANTQSESE